MAVFGTPIVAGVAIPVVAGAAGFVIDRMLGNYIAMKGWGTSDPKLAKTAAAVIGIPAAFMVARKSPLVAKNAGAIVLGMGLAAAEGWIRDTPLLGGSPAAAALTTDIAPAPASASNGGGGGGDGTSGLASYYDYPINAEGQALSDDYYTAQMLGDTADPANQAAVEMSLDNMEQPAAVSTVIPTDLAMPARTMPQWAPVRENFSNKGDRGHAGGLFSRHLFSGMMGS